MTDSVTDLFNMTKPEKEKYEDLVKELGILGIEPPIYAINVQSVHLDVKP